MGPPSKELPGCLLLCALAEVSLKVSQPLHIGAQGDNGVP